MEAKVEDVVVALVRCFCKGEDEPHPSKAFGVAKELAMAMCGRERRLQFLRILALLESEKEMCTDAHIYCSGALILCDASGGGGCGTEETTKWEVEMVSILTAHPPYPKSVLAAVFYSIVQVTLSGCSIAILVAAGDSLRGVDTNLTVPKECAIELLAQFATALVTLNERCKRGPRGMNDDEADEAKIRSEEERGITIRSMVIDYALNAIPYMREESAQGSYLCRRVLIPLLSLGDKALLEYGHSRICSLLTCNAGSQIDTVVLIAALFECLFSCVDGDRQRDYRCSTNLWDTIHAAFYGACTGSGSVENRVNMQSRAEYLLKRIVAVTRDQELREKWDASRIYHPLFVWVPTVSNNLWEMLFLILEVTNDYGMHIIQPILPKLDSLVEKVTADASVWADFGETGDETLLLQLKGGIHPLWVTLLFLKMLVHPNVAFRKIGLMRLWSLSAPLLKLFPRKFLFTSVLEVSLDTRLCAEVDRASHLTSFFGPKGFEGREVSPLVGTAGPLVDQLEQFYALLFCDVVQGAVERKEAMRRMLHCVVEKPSVHGATMILRILHGVVTTLAVEIDDVSRCATVEMITDDVVLTEFMLVLRDAAQEKVPFWIDVRLSAIAFHVLLQFARMDPKTVRKSSNFWKLLCMCGPLGTSAGSSFMTVDTIAHVGVAGTCISPYYLNEHLLSVAQEAGVGGSNYRFVRDLLQVDNVLDKIRNFIRTKGSDEVQGKQLMFLLGALDSMGGEDRQVLADVARELAEMVLSFGRRPYSEAEDIFVALVAFVEFHHSVGSQPCTRYFPLSVILDVEDAVSGLAISSLRQAFHSIKEVTTLGDLSAEAWALQSTSRWDAVVAAVVTISQIAVSYDHSSASVVLRSGKRISDFVELLSVVAEGFPAIVPEDESRRVAQHFAHIVLARNASRALKGMLCGLVGTGDNISINDKRRDEDKTFLRCLSNNDRARCIRTLMRCPALRLSACDIPCSLTDLSWSNVLAQYYGCVYDVIFLLCSCMDQSAVPELVHELEEYGLDQVERCWESNLTSIYGILSWVASAPASPKGDGSVNIDRRSIINAMFGHLGVAGGRDHCRMTVLAFDALRCGVECEEELVKTHIYRTLLDEAQSERAGYIAAVTLSTEVLRDPESNWLRLKELLLHVAVLHNPSREEEGAEVLVAALEPLMLKAWPESLRVQYPPTVRLSYVGRAMAISAILCCCFKKEEWAADVTLQLLEWNNSNPAVNHEPCMPNSKAHRSRMRLWQLLCALVPMVRSPTVQRDLLHVVVMKCLTLTNMGSVRRLMELFALQLLQRQPQLYWIIDNAMANYQLRPQVIGSYVFISAHVILRELRGEVEPVDGLMDTLLHRLFQQSTSHQHMLRLVCHIGLNFIREASVARGIVFSANEESIFDYVANAPEHVKFRVQHAEQLFFDVREACTPRQLFCIQRREGNNILLVSIPAVAFERMRFIDREVACLTGVLTPVDQIRVQVLMQHFEASRVLEPLKEFPYIPHTKSTALFCVDYTREAVAVLTADTHISEGMSSVTGYENVQRKATPWWSSQLYDELHPRALKTERQPVIVIASLLQNPVNVAGLFRCGEVFAVEKVVVSDAAVLEHPHFVAAARSSDLWLPWSAVQVKALSGYLSSLRQDGYTLVGIEQTAGSVPMSSYQFPKRAVIVLGAEGHGIPAQLLTVLDVCVEIPQYGLIRSLNVHVTGSIVMYEYTRQHRMGGAPESS
ncbi:hypothetical protein, conserved [Trypanosoma brucei gambiense DAL972]|uniref:Uncharacterized protein n=2 Tax=Trypanosoma brucei TaxID=5691 RepID=D0AAF5_TRYB9|nr:hypothetical protein, conserved [Trypanosoma brucei gambiense DAL972]CBH18656.1 hypothetical protein, conserved [Trypanosoma brucei gambiense DAL972]|eukprot:XP_011780920.1 hypothetical protein, conserved [Trypanosoma brucei gambiense DAL972]